MTATMKYEMEYASVADAEESGDDDFDPSDFVEDEDGQFEPVAYVAYTDDADDFLAWMYFFDSGEEMRECLLEDEYYYPSVIKAMRLLYARGLHMSIASEVDYFRIDAEISSALLELFRQAEVYLRRFLFPSIEKAFPMAWRKGAKNTLGSYKKVILEYGYEMSLKCRLRMRAYDGRVSDEFACSEEWWHSLANLIGRTADARALLAHNDDLSEEKIDSYFIRNTLTDLFYYSASTGHSAVGLFHSKPMFDEFEAACDIEITDEDVIWGTKIDRPRREKEISQLAIECNESGLLPGPVFSTDEQRKNFCEVVLEYVLFEEGLIDLRHDSFKPTLKGAKNGLRWSRVTVLEKGEWRATTRNDDRLYVTAWAENRIRSILGEHFSHNGK